MKMQHPQPMELSLTIGANNIYTCPILVRSHMPPTTNIEAQKGSLIWCLIGCMPSLLSFCYLSVPLAWNVTDFQQISAGEILLGNGCGSWLQILRYRMEACCDGGEKHFFFTYFFSIRFFFYFVNFSGNWCCKSI